MRAKKPAREMTGKRFAVNVPGAPGEPWSRFEFETLKEAEAKFREVQAGYRGTKELRPMLIQKW